MGTNKHLVWIALSNLESPSWFCSCLAPFSLILGHLPQTMKENWFSSNKRPELMNWRCIIHSSTTTMSMPQKVNRLTWKYSTATNLVHLTNHVRNLQNVNWSLKMLQSMGFNALVVFTAVRLNSTRIPSVSRWMKTMVLKSRFGKSRLKKNILHWCNWYQFSSLFPYLDMWFCSFARGWGKPPLFMEVEQTFHRFQMKPIPWTRGSWTFKIRGNWTHESGGRTGYWKWW